MNLAQLNVHWVDNCMVPRVLIRPITNHVTAEWIDGWFAGVAEFISYRGGRITKFTKEEIK